MSYKDIQKRKNLTSRVLQLQVDRFVSNKNNKIIMPSHPRRATINKNGFIEVLNGAIESHDYETLESTISKEVDLSIKQNGGFSVFFWLYSRKVRNVGDKKKYENKVFYIFKKGGTVDQFTPSVGLIVDIPASEGQGNQQNDASNRKVNLIIELSFLSLQQYCNIKERNLFNSKHLYSITILNKLNNSFFIMLFLSFNLSKHFSKSNFNFCKFIYSLINLHMFSNNLIPSK